MTSRADRRTPADRVSDTDRILYELRQAVREALAQHRRAGNPVAVWRNDRVEWIPAEDIPDEFVTPLPPYEDPAG
jgi:hypothetical protein